MTRRVMTDFEVTGRGDFPLDMLRYDECWPVRAEDVDNLLKKEREDRGPGETTRRTVRLRTYDCVNVHPARWESFGWNVGELLF